MDKTWLIRTKNNHILGPVSKDKVKDLIAKGSIKGDDEICSGNGYWLYIRETELVSKYVLGDIVQSFNPVQEAQTVLSEKKVSPLDNDTHSLSEKNDEDEEVFFPENEDLEYPDIGTTVDSSLKKKDKIEVRRTDVSQDVVVKRKNNAPDSKEVKEPRLKKKPVKKDDLSETPLKPKLVTNKFLYKIAVLFFLIALGLFIFRNQIFTKFMNLSDLSLISNATAQSTQVISSKKKNGFFYQI
jgi:hypothetical protein